MKTLRITSILLLGIIAANIGRAQTVSSNVTGLLGQRYAEFGLGRVNAYGIFDEGTFVDASVNIPVHRNVDLGFGYSYSRTDVQSFSGSLISPVVNSDELSGHILSASATVYSGNQGFKPFAGAAIGYEWAQEKLSFTSTFGSSGTRDIKDDRSIWAIAAGVEIQAGPVTLTPRIAYQDAFSGGNSGAVSLAGEAHLWFTRTLGGFVHVTYTNPTQSGAESFWSYGAGLRMRF